MLCSGKISAISGLPSCTRGISVSSSTASGSPMERAWSSAWDRSSDPSARSRSIAVRTSSSIGGLYTSFSSCWRSSWIDSARRVGSPGSATSSTRTPAAGSAASEFSLERSMLSLPASTTTPGTAGPRPRTDGGLHSGG